MALKQVTMTYLVMLKIYDLAPPAVNLDWILIVVILRVGETMVHQQEIRVRLGALVARVAQTWSDEVVV